MSRRTGTAHVPPWESEAVRSAGRRTDPGPETPHRAGPPADGSPAPGDRAPADAPDPAPDHRDEGADGVRRPEPDEIRLEVPADARFARVARVAVAAAAVRIGLDVTVVEDLRIALDESLILLLRRIPPADATAEGDPPPSASPVLSLTLLARRHDLAVRLELEPPPPPASATDTGDDVEHDAATARFDELLPPRVQAVRVDPEAGVVHLALR
jgi:hypothetical protein